MSNLSFLFRQDRLSSRLSTRDYVLVTASTLAIAAVLAYLDYQHPALRIVSFLAFLFIIAVEAAAGLAMAIIATLAFGIGLSVAELLAQNHASLPYIIPNALARLVSFAIIVALIELIRRQAIAIGEHEVQLQQKELRQTRGALAVADARYSAYETLPFGVWHCNAEGQVVFMSQSFLDLVGMTLEQVRDGGWVSRVVPEDAERIRASWRDRHSWEGVWEDEYRIRSVHGEIFFILCRGRKLLDERGNVVGWTGINLDITQRSKAREQLQFLIEAGRVLSLSLDPATTLERVASLAVPRVADWCAIDILREDGDLQSVVLHADPSKTELARELRAYPRGRDDSQGAWHVVTTGQSELYPEITEEMLKSAASDARHLQLLRQVGFRSAVIVPLRARGKILGTISLVSAESGRRYSQEDVTFMETLAARASLAYDNARIHAREQHVADTLQRASLPTVLPQLPGIRLRATYLPGASESEIGGDWYDAFTLPDGQLALSIGDVAGKGLQAAVAMSSARQAMRGAALEGSHPGEVLERVNRLLSHEGVGMVTALFGFLDPVTLRFTYASAGHPPALLANEDGMVEPLNAKGLPLGLFSDHRYEEQSVILKQGSLLVFYTDGLIEFDRNVIGGEKILLEAVAGEIELQTPDPAASIVRRVIMGVPKDDVAVLSVSIAAHALEYVDLIVQATPSSARVLRQALRRLALSLGLDETHTFNLLVASGEAISNVIEHAYGIKDGMLHLRAVRENGELLVQVKDRGRWRPPQANERGRGLILMKALMDKVEVQNSDEGTAITLRMRLSTHADDRTSKLSTSGV